MKHIKVNDLMFGLVFGKGVVRSVREDSHYAFEVEYENGQVVPYTEDGNPAWNFGEGIRTVFFRRDIDLMEFDFSPTPEVPLTIEEIIKLRTIGKLLVKCESGIWRNVKECPSSEVERLLELSAFYRFKR